MSRTRSQPSGGGQRQLRAGEAVRHALAELLMRGTVHDPVLAEANLTVSEVRMSRDLRQATVFVSELGGHGLRPEVEEALARARPFLRGEVARRINLKYAPDMRFQADPSFDEAERIERLIARERAELGLEPGDDDGSR